MTPPRAPKILRLLGPMLAAACACKPVMTAASGDKAPEGRKPALGSEQQNAGAGADGKAADQADQPVEVVGTYLVCGAEERAATSASVGCNILRRGSKQRVDLRNPAKNVVWAYALPPGLRGSIQVLPQAYGHKWHVLYVLSADSAAELAQLTAQIRIQFDAAPSAGKASKSATHFDVLLAAVMAGDDEVLFDGKTGQIAGGDDGVPPAAPATPAKPLSQAPERSIEDETACNPVTGDGCLPPGVTAPTTRIAPADPAPPTTAPARGPFPALAGKQFTAGCAPVAGGAGYANKYVFFGEENGRHTIGRVIQYYDTACAGVPTRVQKSVPEVTFFYFVGETPVDNAIAVSYNPVSTKLSFYVRMDGDNADSKVEFASGL